MIKWEDWDGAPLSVEQRDDLAERCVKTFGLYSRTGDTFIYISRNADGHIVEIFDMEVRRVGKISKPEGT